jgi:hypothetical protein
MQNKEIWKDIPEYEGFYQVSNIGNVRSFYRTRGMGVRNLSKSKTKKGYLTVSLSLDKIIKTKKVHRLVALAFLGESDLTVNHKNGIKDDNRLKNLEYCTRAENTKHGHISGLMTYSRGENNGKSKLTTDQVLEIRRLSLAGVPRIELASLYNVSPQNISDIILRRKWKHV